MKKILLLIMLLISIQSAYADVTIYTQPINMSCGDMYNPGTIHNFAHTEYQQHYYSIYLTYTFYGADCSHCKSNCGGGYAGSKIEVICEFEGGSQHNYFSDCSEQGHTFSGSYATSGYRTESWSYFYRYQYRFKSGDTGTRNEYCKADGIATLIISPDPPNTVSGATGCIEKTELYIKNNGEWVICNGTTSEYYSFTIYNGSDYLLVFDDGYGYEFTCNGSDVEYDYSACNYIYGYTCNINWVKLWRNDAGSWTYVDMESQPNHGLNTYVLQIESGYDYKVNFSDGHEHEFTCSGSDIRYDWDRCVWAYPPSPWQPPEIIPWYLGYDNNIVFMRDSHGNFIENAQIAVYNKNTGNYTQKWTNTPDPYILLAANNDSNDDVIVMCRTFDGIFTLETVDPAFGTDENVTWTNWTIPIMYNLKIHPIDQSNMPMHHVFVSMYEYTPFDPLAFFGYDTYWGCIPVTNCSGFSRCDIVAEKEGYRDYNVTGLNWTTKSALVKDYKQDIVLVRES